jgi:hypothetical protein
VELHFRVYVGFGVQIPAEEYLARASLYRTQQGSQCYVLSPEDEFVYLVLHAAGHDFARLGWLYDLKVFLRRYSELRWDQVRAQTARLGTRVAFAFAAAILEKRLEITNPGLLGCAAGLRNRVVLAQRLLTMTESLPQGSEREKLASLLLQACLCDRPSAGLWYLQHHLLRVARRRVQRHWPRLVPLDWSA